MKKRFKSRKKLNNLKKIIYLIFILIGFFLSYLYFYYKVRNMISSEDYLNYLLKVGFNKQIDSSYIKSSLLSNITFDNTSVTENNNDDTSQITDKSNTKEVLNSTKPIIYIYSTHDTEGYASSYFNIYNIKPDVKIASYYLQEKLSDLGLNTIVEKRMIKDALNKNNWVYKDSYKASRIYLENTYQNNTSLKYFIDLHRDSSLKSKTTTTIDGKSYARVMFLVGLEHDNYNANLKVATDINNLIKAKYPSLTRGIYKKSGPGVNGIYNQDFNSNCILIELGGQYNTMLEVSNTIDILAKILYDYIGENI
ncbi:MAG: stage II sporulation protein P [Bacilli bacterium]|nr:stage II sporulation protein P [Bacilli bacterium]